MTAVMRPADALRQASIMMSSSMRLLLTGSQVDWTRKTSEPRTDSPMDTEISPSEKVLTLALPSGRPRADAICMARAGCELPQKILMFLP